MDADIGFFSARWLIDVPFYAGFTGADHPVGRHSWRQLLMKRLLSA
ncbi:MAG: hypothetical protein IPO20_07610 [Gammaproteobacteria bacterium]|nr:hypothetical protein [Gammaproteobacteria bacterium]